MGKEISEIQGSYNEEIFKNITHYDQLDQDIVRGIIQCVKGSGMDTSEEDIFNHIKGDRIVVLSDQSGIFAFSSTNFISPNSYFQKSGFSEVEGCYLAGATVLAERATEGYYKLMNRRRIGFGLEKGLDLVFTNTQNPRVYAGCLNVLDEMKATGTIGDYREERILLPGHYGKMLTREKPTHHTIEFSDLDYSKGDAYAMLFHIQRNGQNEI